MQHPAGVQPLPYIIDSHQDIAWNVSLGRDFLIPAARWRAEVNDGFKYGERLVTLPDLLDSPVRLVIGTIFVLPARLANRWESRNYASPAEAYRLGREQLEFYRQLAGCEPAVKLIGNRRELDGFIAEVEAGARQLGIIISMEGADPIIEPAQLAEWVAGGLRLVGPAWRATRYCGGTAEPGPLTPAGFELLAEMERLGVVLDVSHMAEESFYQALDVYQGTVIASHSNCRHYVNTDRQLSDDMIRRLVERDGVIGVVLYNPFLAEPAEQRRPGLEDVVRHIRRICELAGHTRAVAIGTDWDGGFGGEAIPTPLAGLNDLPLLGEALLRAGFNPDDVTGIFHGNWLRALRRALATFD